MFAQRVGENLPMTNEPASCCHEDRQFMSLELTVDAVRRCLFGPADRQLVRNDLRTLRQQIDVQTRERWNFDFRSGTPLPAASAGYIWTRVDRLAAAVDGSLRLKDDTSRCTSPARCPSTPTSRPSTPVADRLTPASKLPSSPRRTPSSAVSAKRRRMSLATLPITMPGEPLKQTPNSKLSEMMLLRKTTSSPSLERKRKFRPTSILGKFLDWFVCRLIIL